MALRELHLFAGAGGGILGGLLLGHRPVCAVEIEPYCRDILLQRQRDGVLPRFPVWDDVRTFDGRPWRGRVDVVAGGFPCQDISCAGKGRGIEGARSGLWSEMARIIREVRPGIVFVENSPMLVRRGLAVVLGDLASMGFDAVWGVVGAHHVGAPHKRDRIWILAHANGGRGEGRCLLTRGADTEDGARKASFPPGPSPSVGDPASQGPLSSTQPGIHSQEAGARPRNEKSERRGADVANPGGRRLGEQGTREDEQPRRTEDFSASQNDPDPSCSGLEEQRSAVSVQKEQPGIKCFCPCVANTDCERRNKKRGPESGSRIGGSGSQTCVGDIPDSGRWGGEGTWDPERESARASWWLPEPRLDRVAHGVANRVDRIKAIGNGQVPLVAATAWRILERELI